MMWETYDDQKAQNFLMWLIESGVDFKVSREAQPDRNDTVVKWTFNFLSSPLIEFIADRGLR